ncbi:hypothetical protein UP09_30835 [Bradyrhizobium sp. LTSP885]|uniref:hypothetical protein n=1 Tax=Bradyrhizobium sp. LTSP885 TaxID=1619232 RepID=UPI0005C87422|nr:hypothetical protein [Bradyrhizobium sp. LTSP885]KJC35627.1 hypothetical protein UP09_30835 [Bradyrhizobium sp. LTSP885]
MIRIVSILCIAAAIAIPTTASFGKGGGGGGMHHSSTGGASGTSPGAPGTNAAGTALSSSGVGSQMKGANLDNGPAVARQDAAVDKLVKSSICHGC